MMKLWEDDSPDVIQKAWMRDKKMELVTVETLKWVVDQCIAAGKYAHDIETTGLDTRVFDGRTKDYIVGHCLSPDGERGYYVPVRHRKGTHHNLPVTLVQEEMARLGESGAIAYFFNASFDQEFLEFCGGTPMGAKKWDNPTKFEDAMLLAYLRDPAGRDMSLKDLSKALLQKEMIELHELFPKNYKGKKDFAELDPSNEEVLWYACSDAICTFLLTEYLMPIICKPGPPTESQGFIYSIEKLCVPATRWMERNRIYIRQDKVEELIALGQREYFECLEELYMSCREKLRRSVAPPWFSLLKDRWNKRKQQEEDATRTGTKLEPFSILEWIKELRDEAYKRRGLIEEDTSETELESQGEQSQGDTFRKMKDGVLREFPLQYDVLSRQQIGTLFQELEIPDLRKTGKSEQVLTSADEIERLSKEYGHAFPFLPKFVRLGELQTALSRYLVSLRDDVAPDGTLKVRYRQAGTDTGRFTTPASKNPKVDGGTKYPMHGTPATYDKSRPECLLRIREVIGARKGRAIGALDLSGAELRIATNISGEPKWLREFFRCSTCGTEFSRGDGNSTPEPPPPYCPKCGSDRIGDLHTVTAIAFYGEEKVKKDKQPRQNAKSANFALLYGGGPAALMMATHCDKNEAHRQHQSFEHNYPTLVTWWKDIRAFGATKGYVYTMFGRHYPVPDLKLSTNSRQVTDPEQLKRNRMDKAKAERNATNAPIQAFCADVIKLAMGLIYKECKKRGWLSKCQMIITIHDELVFEIDLDILAEAVEMISHLMTRNSTLLSLKWPVPMTSDCEIGWDWTVPFNLKNFKAGRVLPDGVELDGKGKPTGTVWPQELLEILGRKFAFAEAPKPAEAAPKNLVHVMEVDQITLGLVERLATLLSKINGSGDYRLEVRTKTGQNLLWIGAEFRVDPSLCILN